MKLLKALARLSLALSVCLALLIAVKFPYDHDQPVSAQEVEAVKKFYREAYQKPAETKGPSDYETAYVRESERATTVYRIEEQVREFVSRFNLKDKKILEIGSGRGHLQDLADDYTGLDISSSAARFYHKKFVLGSATAMPFPDNSFDAIWTIWVFEHVPNPEQAFYEARRVTRDGGLLFLLPGWNSPTWAADGYQVRPYSDFGLWGKIVKATIPMRRSMAFKAITALPVRGVRIIAGRSGPTTLRYRRLEPNYETYWEADSDAVNSIDSHEAILWFTTRGDECLNCGSDPIFFPVAHTPLIIRVNKSGSERTEARTGH